MSRNIVLMASSEFPFPAEDIRIIREESPVPGTEIFMMPDSDRWTWYCGGWFRFRILGARLLKPLLDEVGHDQDVRITFVVHKKRVLYPACAIISLLQRKGMVKWSGARILLFQDCGSDSEIARTCHEHEIPSGIIVCSEDCPERPYIEIERLNMH